MGYFKRRPDRGRWRDETRSLAEDVAGAPWESIPGEPPKAPCFVRFAVEEIHPLSNRRTGLFTAAYGVIYAAETDPHDCERLREALAWFQDHLAGPELDDDRVVFLFKSEAAECMRRIWDLVHALRAAGVWVQMQVATNPGRIVYEDEHQVAVVPWADEREL